MVNTVRLNAPDDAKCLFNHSPNSSVEAAQRQFPVGDCTGKPGQNFGQTIVCAACVTPP